MQRPVVLTIVLKETFFWLHTHNFGSCDSPQTKLGLIQRWPDLQNSIEMLVAIAREMAQHGKARAAKPKDWSPVPRTHMLEEEHGFLPVVL